MRAALKGLYSKYDAAYIKNPILMAGATMGAKASFCDIIAQRYEDPNCPVDWSRCGKFTFFCVAYVGSFQHLLFNKLYPRLFPGTGALQAAKCALFDNFVHSPCLYLPTYYTYRSFTSHGSLTDGLTQYRREGYDVLKACWGIWVPSQFINFYLVPPNFRILFIAGMGSVWEIVLSYMAPMKHTGPLTDPHTPEGFEEDDSERTVRRRVSERELAEEKAREEENKTAVAAAISAAPTAAPAPAVAATATVTAK
mmetsp:Transcript_91552/g.261668  ORF Transcript_91552/g.261668 Transcript_91552/m.261668 type:complete len:253 (-) Transcript_91552:129-887(-)